MHANNVCSACTIRNHDRPPAENPGNRDLYEIGSDGSGLARLTSNEGDDALPAWSPQGDRIVFQSERDGVAGLWILERDSGVAGLLLEDDTAELIPHWSPDGRRVVAAISDSVDDRGLAIYDLDGRQLHSFAEGFHRVSQPAWSPDGA